MLHRVHCYYVVGSYDNIYILSTYMYTYAVCRPQVNEILDGLGDFFTPFPAGPHTVHSHTVHLPLGALLT